MTALLLRFSTALSLFAMLLIWEQVAPKRPRGPGRGRRWQANLGLQLINAAVLLIVSAVVPSLLVGLAYACESRGIGLLHRVAWPWPVKAALAFVVLDLTIYLQHRAFHALPALWRLHRVHHTDLDLDLTTGLRFHPGEILLSLVIKAAAIAVFGAHFLAVAIFEVALNAFSLFTHANAALPDAAERALRLLLVTPDMHRIHHSERPEETDSNFGFQLSCWDRWLGTYRAKARDGQKGLRYGLPGPEPCPPMGPLQLLWLPLEAP